MINFFTVKKILRKVITLGVAIFSILFIISCEEDFANIGSNVISNTKFDTNSIEIEVSLENSPLEKLQSDNISRQLNQYLLGVYNSSDYEKLEASIVSQVGVVTDLKVVDNTYGADTTVVTKIDTVFIKLPYQVLLNDTSNNYDLDSVFGDASNSFKLNVYRSNTFMNAFNPLDPTKRNSYQSNDAFEKIGNNLNATPDYQITPSKNDTLIAIKRRLFDDSVANIDTVKLSFTTSNPIPIPFARIPLDESEIKSIFLDKYESSEFTSQDAFNDYLRGIILEASGNESSLVSFSFNSTNSTLIPSIEIYYTNTVLKTENNVTSPVDTIYKNNSFPLTGFRVNTFNMDNRTYPANNEVKIQGTSGSEGRLKLMTPNDISNLRSQNWLINDATVTVYVNQSADTTNVPSRLYLYKYYDLGTSTITSQIKDTYSEALFGGIGGFLQRDDNGKIESYTFNITDYISDIASGEINDFPDVKIKAFNTTDLPVSGTDTIFNNFSWNPKAVTLFNSLNSTKKPVLKISYSEKK